MIRMNRHLNVRPQIDLAVDNILTFQNDIRRYNDRRAVIKSQMKGLDRRDPKRKELNKIFKRYGEFKKSAEDNILKIKESVGK